jgi:hypothetical protein
MERFGVYVYGRTPTNPTAAETLSRAGQVSVADARQMLLSKIPRRVSDHADPVQAAARAAEIRSAGLIAFTVDLQELAAWRPSEVRGAAFEGPGVSFRPAGQFPPGALRMILHGRSTTSTEVRSEATVHDPQSLARLGNGIAQLRSEQGEHFAHLYGADPAEVYELRANRFDFRCLGSPPAPTCVESLRMFLDRLRGLFSDAIYDDTLVRYPLRDRTERDYSFSASVFVVSVEQHGAKGSTEPAARRASLLIARARLGL